MEILFITQLQLIAFTAIILLEVYYYARRGQQMNDFEAKIRMIVLQLKMLVPANDTESYLVKLLDWACGNTKAPPVSEEYNLTTGTCTACGSDILGADADSCNNCDQIISSLINEMAELNITEAEEEKLLLEFRRSL
jgi:hypothetical protein